MPSELNTYDFHIFLSHNRSDRAWTRDLAKGLRSRGLVIFLDEDSVRLGDDVPTAIEHALVRSRHILLVLSPEALSSKWVALEISMSLYRDPDAAERSVIPIIIKECKVPLMLSRINYLDAREKDLELCIQEIITSIDTTILIGNDQQKISSPTSAHRMAHLLPRFHIGGAVPVDRCVYVMREADHEAKSAIDDGGTLVVHGPRLIGKSCPAAPSPPTRFACSCTRSPTTSATSCGCWSCPGPSSTGR